MTESRAARWGAVSVFALASTWNYLDRLVLSAAQPAIRSEFHLSNEQFGWLLFAFSIAYAAASPATGWLLDKLGVELAMVWSVAIWSATSVFTGLSRGFVQLFGLRAVLGAAESTGVPAAGKLNAAFLEPKNRAIGAAITQVGLSIAGFAAPKLVAAVGDWRRAFYVCAALGFVWIPVWLLVRRAVRPIEDVRPQLRSHGAALFRDRRLQILTVANMLWMGSYSLWTNWTTGFLVQSYGLTIKTVASYAAIPPIAATLGAFAGGWISRQAIARGKDPVGARVSAALVSAVGCLIIAFAAGCATPMQATIVISLSSFWAVAGSVNLYTIPVDIWGAERAGSAVSALVFGYGVLQAVISPLIGASVDRFHGYGPVCLAIAPMPLVAWWMLRGIQSEKEL